MADLARDHALVDQFEVRVEVTERRRWARRDQEPQGAGWKRVAGVGVRAFHDAASGFAYTDDPEVHDLEDVVDRAARLARNHAGADWDGFPPRHDETSPDGTRRYRSQVDVHPHEADPDRVDGFLRRAEEAILEEAPEARPQVAFGTRRQETVLAASGGTRMEREVLLSSVIVQGILEDADDRGEGVVGRGGERGLGDYVDDESPEALGRQVGRRAREDLEAEPVEPGRYRTLLGNRLAGLLVHESFGHLTEYDLVSPGWSVLQGRLGDRLASPDVTIRDAPRVPDAPEQGVPVPFDHEGTRGRSVTLLDDGVLSGYLHRRDTAPGEEAAPTGNARALHVHHGPIVRMRNTYMEPGDLTREEAVEQVGDGVYLKGGRGGSPRPDGSFSFTAQHGYRIRDGEIAEPVKMATIHGDALSFLEGVEDLTRDFRVDTNTFGGCGKWGQNRLPVGIGGPHIVLDEALVGGRNA